LIKAIKIKQNNNRLSNLTISNWNCF